MVKGKPGVMIYFETARAIKGLDYETKGRLFEAIMEYAEDGTVPDFDGVLAAVWPFVAEKIKRDSEKYNRIREKRAIAGRKGGEARATNEKQKEANEANEPFDKQIKPTVTTTITATATATATGESTADSDESAPAPVDGEEASVEEKPKKADKPVKHRHGEYQNVLLTEDELTSLQAEYPDWQARIDNLSRYIASKGAKYKSHYATIRNWARKDAEDARAAPDHAARPEQQAQPQSQAHGNPFLAYVWDHGGGDGQ